MTRIQAGAVLGFALAATAVATAQPPGKPPAVIQFKQFGSTPDQLYHSSITRWTGQLILDLEAVKGDIGKANLSPIARVNILNLIQDAQRRTTELDQLVRRGGPKDPVFTAFADLDRIMDSLLLALTQQPEARQATATSRARTNFSHNQLAVAVGTGDTDPVRARWRLGRLAESVDDNADELRTLVGELIGGNDRTLERLIGEYARDARVLGRQVRDGANAEQIKRIYTQMAGRWSDVTTAFRRLRNVPPAVSGQVTRVDIMHRRLGSVVGLPAVPVGGDPGGVPLLPPAGGKNLSFAVGADTGVQPRVSVFADERGTLAFTFFAYDLKFDGGVRVDMADLNGDGVPELIVAPGPAKNPVTLPVRVYDGRDMNLLVEFVPFAGWKGGVFVSGTDLTRDGRALIAATAEGTQHVKVFDLAQGKEIDSFFVHDQKVPGGVRIGWGDVNGDGTPDLLTVNGPSNVVTVVKVFNGKNRDVLLEFPAVDNKYRGGAYIAAADITGDGRANPVIGLDAGAPPVVRVFDSRGKMLAEWLAFEERFRGGVRVAVSARNHVVVGPGAGVKNSPVRVFDAARPKAPMAEVVPFVGFDGGIHVGGRVLLGSSFIQHPGCFSHTHRRTRGTHRHHR